MLWIRRIWPQIVTLALAALLARMANSRTEGSTRWTILSIGIVIGVWALVSGTRKIVYLRRLLFGAHKATAVAPLDSLGAPLRTNLGATERISPVADRQVRFRLPPGSGKTRSMEHDDCVRLSRWRSGGRSWGY